MTLRRYLAAALVVTALVAAPATAAAQPAGVDESIRDRLDRIEKQLHEVREIVLQARSTGQPVEIKEAGPDPQVAQLSAKFDDMDQTLRSLNGQIESLAHDVQLARKDADDAKAAEAAMGDRLTKLEQAMAGMAQPAPQQPQPQANQTLGPPDAQGGPPAGGDPKAAYAHARELLLSGDYAGAQTAFQAYVDQYGTSADAAQARYWLGETKYVQGDYAGAAVAYIAAKRGFPQTAWGADAEIKLALALIELGKPADACAALDEFAKHYPKAGEAAKGRAATARVRAKCEA